MTMKEIKYSDYSTLKKFFSHQRYNLCVYSLPSIIAWRNEKYMPLGIIEKDALIIGAQFTEERDKSHLILPVSPSLEYTPRELYKLAGKLGFQKYWFVTGEYIEKFGKDETESCFRISEQKEYEDYVYLREDLSALKGNRYSQKRNLIHQFERDYVAKERVEKGSIKSDVSSECIDFLEKWCIERNCEPADNDALACEKEAVINTLNNIDLLDVRGLYLRVDGKMSAFGIASYLTDEIGVLHFEKAFAGIKGLYQYFDNLCAKILFDGFTYINKESDMSIPGLAKVKKSYHPAMMIKSYRLDLL
ncbi:MAG: DUF2156 domain-containing protein [Desulfobacteraceae bacterium]|nr:MAG: DUF2156 domain-containing protein [Desulfobacteraceae bacterium]